MTPTDTPTFSPTSTPTLTPPAFTVAGQVLYYGTPAPVSSVSVAFQGPTPTVTTTDLFGDYSQPLLAGATWNVVPSKVGDRNDKITAIDATFVLQAVVNLITLTPLQRLACDANGSGTLTAIDASLILQFRVGLITQLPAMQQCGSDWVFEPAAAGNTTAVQISGGVCQMGSITYDPLSQDMSGQDFLGILLGDCNASWQPATGGGASVASATLAPRLGQPHYHNGRITVPIFVESSQPLSALDLEVSYGGRHARALGVRRTAATRRAMLAANTTRRGTIRIALASPEPIAGNGPMLLLRFETRRPAATLRSLRFSHAGQ